MSSTWVLGGLCRGDEGAGADRERAGASVLCGAADSGVEVSEEVSGVVAEVDGAAVDGACGGAADSLPEVTVTRLM